MIAGGASFAPSRWSLPALAMLARSSPCHLLTARRTAVQNTRNCMLSCGLAPGVEQVVPLVVAHRPVEVLARSVHAGERLLVQQAGEPVLRRRPPAASPSSSSDDRWRRWRSRRPARSRYWLGATSLCRVLTGTPTLYSSLSTSDMNAMTRSGMAPKY